jgi:hypothetical protein
MLIPMSMREHLITWATDPQGYYSQERQTQAQTKYSPTGQQRTTAVNYYQDQERRDNSQYGKPVYQPPINVPQQATPREFRDKQN